jgi:hypothetical protein
VAARPAEVDKLKTIGPDVPITVIDMAKGVWACTCPRCAACERPHQPDRRCNVAQSMRATYVYCCEREWGLEFMVESLAESAAAQVERETVNALPFW